MTLRVSPPARVLGSRDALPTGIVSALFSRQPTHVRDLGSSRPEVAFLRAKRKARPTSRVARFARGPPQALLLSPEQMQWPMPASPRIAREPSCASVLASAPKFHAAFALLAFPDAVIAEECNSCTVVRIGRFCFCDLMRSGRLWHLSPSGPNSTTSPDVDQRGEGRNAGRPLGSRGWTSILGRSYRAAGGTAALRPTDCSAAGRIRSGARWLAGWRTVASGDAQSRAHRAVVIGWNHAARVPLMGTRAHES